MKIHFAIGLVTSVTAFGQVWTSDCIKDEYSALHRRYTFSLTATQAEMDVEMFYNKTCALMSKASSDRVKADIEMIGPDTFAYTITASEIRIFDPILAERFAVKSICGIRSWNSQGWEDVSGTGCHFLSFKKGDTGKTRLYFSDEKMGFDKQLGFRINSFKAHVE